MSAGFEQKWTCIFFGDNKPFSKILLLKRDSNRKLEPDKYCGLGGKIEKGETNQAGAIRELQEEAPAIGSASMKEFGQLIINKQKSLHYFFGVLEDQSVSACTEGVLEWVSVQHVLEKDLIPSTKIFIKEWQKRNWDISPFTILLERVDADDTESKILSYEIVEGLV